MLASAGLALYGLLTGGMPTITVTGHCLKPDGEERVFSLSCRFDAEMKKTIVVPYWDLP